MKANTAKRSPLGGVLAAGGAMALLVLTAACQKNSPVRPSDSAGVGTTADVASVTDAKSGVTLSSPRLVTPEDGANIPYAQQPITLTIGNAVTTGKTALTYTFDVSTDSGFGSTVYTKSGVAAGGTQTTLQIDKLAGATTYYWRARASSGSFEGPNAKAHSFKVGPEVVLQAPVLASPGANDTVNQQPTLTVNNVQRSGPAGNIEYRFEISHASDFGSLAYVATVAERSDLSYTQHTVSQRLDEGTYWWRVQATDTTNSVTSPYSAANPFKVTRGLDLNTVSVVMGPANIGQWEETAQITNAFWADGQLCIYHTRLGIWPGVPFFGDAGTLVEGNQWVFAFINGQWYGGAADWYRPGQACKGVDANSIGRDAFYLPTQEPLHSWVPHSGEIFGVMSSTPARLWPDMRTYDERTNVQLIQWP
jgi:hypothetical protein